MSQILCTDQLGDKLCAQAHTTQGLALALRRGSCAFRRGSLWGAMSGRKEELLAEQAALDSALAATKKVLRATQKSEQAAKKRSDAHWKLSEFLKRVALILLVTAEHDPAAAATFLAQQAARRRWGPKPEAEVRRLVEDLFMEPDLEDLAGLCDAANSSHPDCMRAAMGFWQEWSLSVWVEGANVRQGVAPSTAAVLDQHERQRQAIPAEARPLARGVVAQSRAKSWASRWRKRFGLRHGSVPACDIPPVQEMREKAWRLVDKNRGRSDVARIVCCRRPFVEARARPSAMFSKSFGVFRGPISKSEMEKASPDSGPKGRPESGFKMRPEIEFLYIKCKGASKMRSRFEVGIRFHFGAAPFPPS